MFRFHKEPFLHIVDILKDDFPTGRGAISAEKRVGLFLSYCSGNETQVELSFYPQNLVQTSPLTVTPVRVRFKATVTVFGLLKGSPYTKNSDYSVILLTLTLFGRPNTVTVSGEACINYNGS